MGGCGGRGVRGQECGVGERCCVALRCVAIARGDGRGLWGGMGSLSLLALTAVLAPCPLGLEAREV